MITDKQLFVQMLERDVLNLYEMLVQRVPLCSLPMVKQTAFSYADKGIEYITNLLFGIDENSSIDEASDMAKLIANDKIEEYREKLRKQKENI